MNKKKKIILRISLVLFGLILILLLFLPTIIKNYAIKHSKELVGRQIDIENLNYNYFTSTLEVTNFKMFESNETDHFTTFNTLIVDLEPLKLIKNKIEIEEIFLEGLMVKTVMKDSTFNFDDLIRFHSSEEDTSSDSVEEEPFKYSLSNLELKGANFYFDNQNVGRETQIEDFSFLIPYVGWDQETKSNADLKFNFKKGGYLQSSLNINPVNGEFDAAISIKNLYLNAFYEYLLEYANINSIDGQLNAKISIQGNTNEAVKSLVSGAVDINNFKMTDTNNKEFLAAKTIHSSLKEIDYFNSSYALDTLNISESYTYFKLDSISNNFYSIFKLDEPSTSDQEQNENVSISDSTATNGNAIYYAINSFSIHNGKLDYTDNLTGKPFDYHLNNIEINSEKIISDSEWIDINANMLLNNRGTLKAEIGYNPSNTLYSELDIVIENFLLSDINIYSNYYTGHDILQGDMYYYSNSKITNGDIVSENKLLIKEVTINTTDQGLYKLPLKFALFLLKDKNGDVNLDIPVRGDLNDPEVQIGKIVWNSFKNLIVKTVASPVKFLAGLVDGDPKELEGMDFKYTDTIPNENQFRKLDKLLELETKKEGLKIELVHYADRNLQKEEIALDLIGQQFNEETKKDYLKDEKDFEAYLQTKAALDSISTKEAISKLTNAINLDSLSNSYNQKLINNTQSYLKTTKASTHIEVKQSNLDDIKNTGSLSRFKMNYNLLEDSEDTISNNTDSQR
ncbi:DUF748 domain-containing protein [Algibacter mikhailovii]|uniref:DUF748 domain-containing protein n=1 Tax=Algibacter mikhailovii TaxID=425498 RepID=UPI0024944AA9|nr:DUF748 domain-containing protein [Algibacter mikhailovii]